MAYTQITVQSTGYTGAPGWTKMKFMGSLAPAEASTGAANFRTFLNAAGTTTMPSGATWTFLSAYQTFDSSGALDGEFALTTVPSAVTGAASGAYAGGAGCVVNWLTDSFVGGKKIRGRTFLVPLHSAAFQADGTLADGFKASLQTAANTFALSTPQPAVWSVRDLGGSIVRTIAGMKGATVPDRAALLRSRRD